MDFSNLRRPFDRGRVEQTLSPESAKGQTGLSVAFDLPTQNGLDSDHPLARGEVGKVGVAISHIGDMRALFEEIPLASMNTSMTINATAPWLMALYIAVADEQGAPRDQLQGTTQNDIIKEYLARGSYVYPPGGFAAADKRSYSILCRETPKWNPMNVCSYHLQEAGATPGAGVELRPGDGDRRARSGAQSGEVDEEGFAMWSGGFRSSSTPACASSRNSPKCGRSSSSGMRSRGTVWGQGSSEAAVPIRRSGQFAWFDRAAAGKQCLSDPDRDVVGRAFKGCTRARRAVAGLERSARIAASVRPAMVASSAANHGVRNGSAGIRRYLQRKHGDRRRLSKG